jgi:hypothetical protein
MKMTIFLCAMSMAIFPAAAFIVSPSSAFAEEAGNGAEASAEESAPKTAAASDARAQSSVGPSETAAPPADPAAAADATDATAQVSAPTVVGGAEPAAGSEAESAGTEQPKQSFKDEAADFFGAIGIRVLPDEAYPTYKTRGITGGSLWRTFHGLQWPYMQKSGIGISGSLWIDTGYEKISRQEDPNQPDTKYILQEGRFVLRVTPTYSRNRWFIQGQSEFVANKDQSVSQPQIADVDDLWVKVGMWNLWDLQVGRYEAWELYHFGMGMDLNTLERRGAFEATSGLSVPDVYGVTNCYYRPSGLGNVAAHIYPTKFFRMELLGQLGNEGGLNTGAFRGAGILDFGFVKIKGGGEYKVQRSQNDGPEKRDERGVGGTIQFIINPYVEFGASGGWDIADHMDSKGNIDEKGSYITWSGGGFANVRLIKDLLFGLGANYTWLFDIHEDEKGNVGEFSHLQTFAAIQYLLFDRLYIKLVGAYARGYFAPSFTENDPYHNDMFSGRLRLEYAF